MENWHREYTDKETHKFIREIAEVTEFYVDEDNNAKSNTIYRKTAEGTVNRKNPSKYLIDYLEVQGVYLPKEMRLLGENVPLSEAEGQQKENSNGAIPIIDNSMNTPVNQNVVNTQNTINYEPGKPEVFNRVEPTILNNQSNGQASNNLPFNQNPAMDQSVQVNNQLNDNKNE